MAQERTSRMSGRRNGSPPVMCRWNTPLFESFSSAKHNWSVESSLNELLFQITIPAPGITPRGDFDAGDEGISLARDAV